MAITAADIHNQSFSIDRKGYDVDEVDVFLEHVANEIDDLNARIEEQMDDASFAGFDRPAARIDEPIDSLACASSEELAAKDELIADLERQLEAKKADDNAIAQALIIAQRSADEIISNANAQAANTIKDAEEEAKRIVDKAEAEKRKVHEAIKKLEDDREDAREDYQEMLTDFISDATRRLAEIGGDLSGVSTPASAHARVSAAPTSNVTGRMVSAPAQAPINVDASAAYSTPQAAGAVAVAAATPMPSGIEKDLSGFGDADDDFEFEEID